jgi:hypothetical protein
VESWTDDFGTTFSVHDVGNCEREYCTIHNNSEHPLSMAPQRLRLTKNELFIMVRVCVHGEEHYDADEVNKVLVASCSLRCDGCCVFKEQDG